MSEENEDEINILESYILSMDDDDNPTSTINNATTSLNTDGIISNKHKETSVIHTGDTDSSDDEESKNCFNQKYNGFGKDIQEMLQNKKKEDTDKEINSILNNYEFTTATKKTRESFKFSEKPTGTVKLPNTLNVYVDPIFQMRLLNPLISMQALNEKMTGRIAISIPRIRKFIETGDLSKDWVVAGAIINKSPIKVSQKGNQYCIWKLSDLKGDIKMISLFLFKNAYKDLWKTAEGTVIAILNPRIFEKSNNSREEACLTIDNAQKIMILGISKDLGYCKSKKKNGEKCSALINLGTCDYCVYHVKQEYSKASKRSELQMVTGSRGLQDLKNKVLGKNEVFYGGQMYTAVRATKNPKLIAQDKNRLTKLSEFGNVITTAPIKKLKQFDGSAAKNDISVKQRQQDVERLKLLKLSMDSSVSNNSLNIEENVKNHNLTVNNPTLKNNKTLQQSFAAAVPEQFKNRNFSFSQTAPKLNGENFSLNFNKTIKSSNFAKSKAMEILKSKPIEKINPNFIRHRGTEAGRKRALDELGRNNDNVIIKKPKIEISLEEKARKERLRQIIESTSSHTDLIEKFENDEQEKYFNKLEKKEEMEDKMMNTFKIACKAVICNDCKYMAFSASDKCKSEKHSLKVIDGEKRFFKCSDCNYRTATLYRIPKLSCKNCKSSRWERTAMMKDTNVLGINPLSIRGDEESFIGGQIKGNINLLVPEDQVTL